MTDPRQPQDDLVSAVLDGEADEAERAAVERDPTLMARLAAFGSVRDAVAADLPAPDAARREAVIAVALAAADQPEGAATAPVTSLDEAHRRRSLIARRVLLAGAAIVGVLALAGGLTRLGGDGDDRSSTQAADAPADEADTSGEAVTASEPLTLGAIDDPNTLAQRVAEETGFGGDTAGFGAEPAAPAIGGALEAQDDGAAPRTATGDDDGPRSSEDCTVELIEDRPELRGQLAHGTLTYQGVDAHLYVYHDPSTDGVLAIVVSTADCAVIVEVPF